MIHRRLILMLAASGMMLGGVSTAGAGTLAHAAGVGTLTSTGWSYTNWSGYATRTKKATEIAGDWTVPTVTATSTNTYSSTWIGIDGFTNDDLIQTGTEQDWFSGHTIYRAWWEILPANETIIPSLVVHPGDVFQAEIFLDSGTTWTINIEDVTTTEFFSINEKYTGPRDSVDWIQEAPTVNGKIATLAHYGQTTFDQCEFDRSTINFTAAERGVMVQHGKRVSTPSEPGSLPDAFTVAYGSTTPPAPESRGS
jgi:hypothetical protein